MNKILEKSQRLCIHSFLSETYDIPEDIIKRKQNKRKKNQTNKEKKLPENQETLIISNLRP